MNAPLQRLKKLAGISEALLAMEGGGALERAPLLARDPFDGLRAQCPCLRCLCVAAIERVHAVEYLVGDQPKRIDIIRRAGLAILDHFERRV